MEEPRKAPDAAVVVADHPLRPVEYYCKLPSARPVDVALVLDPMLATGGSAVAALATVEARACPGSSSWR